MEKKLTPHVGFNKDAKLVLIGLLKRTIELIRLDFIVEPADIGIVAAHLRDFCCFLDHTGEHSTDGFFGGFDGDTGWIGLCERLQETSDLEWDVILRDHLLGIEWKKAREAKKAVLDEAIA